MNPNINEKEQCFNEFTKKISLTQAYISSYLKERNRVNRRVSTIAGAVFMIIFGSIALATRNTFWICFFIAHATVIVISYFWFGKNIKATNNLDYYIKQDQCIEKEIKAHYDCDGPTTYTHHLIFQVNGDYVVAKGGYKRDVQALKTNWQEYTHLNLYNEVDEGDHCYIVFFRHSTKIRMVLPRKIFCLCEEEFYLQNGVFFPKTTK